MRLRIHGRLKAAVVITCAAGVAAGLAAAADVGPFSGLASVHGAPTSPISGHAIRPTQVRADSLYPQPTIPAAVVEVVTVQDPPVVIEAQPTVPGGSPSDSVNPSSAPPDVHEPTSAPPAPGQSGTRPTSSAPPAGPTATPSPSSTARPTASPSPAPCRAPCGSPTPSPGPTETPDPGGD